MEVNKMDHIYPAVFCLNEDESYTVTYPDLPGCISEGKDLTNAIDMAQSALLQWVEYLSSEKQEIPKASEIKKIKINENEFASLIRVMKRDERAVKRTVSLPKWMDEKVSSEGWSLSRVLQDAITQKIH